MVVHYIMFLFKDKTRNEEMKDYLLSLKKIKEIKKLEVHLDELNFARSYDLIMRVEVDNYEDLNAYQNDEYHIKIRNLMMDNVLHNVIIDYKED